MSEQSKADMKTSMRFVIVTLAICSWIAASNHCAFAAVATESDKAQTECPFHSKPAKQKEHSSQVQCCKILRAVVVAQSKAWERDDAKFSDAGLCVEERALFSSPLCTLVPLFLDTGPPEALSFAELILQRSLFAHAPPFLP